MNPPPVPQNKTSGLAIASLVLGILSVTCCGCLSGIAAVITGHMARGRIKASAGMESGSGLALAGLILGYVSFFASIIASAIALPAAVTGLTKAQMVIAKNNGTQIYQAVSATQTWPSESGASSAPEFFRLLVEKNALTQEELSRLHVEDFLVGNVAADDPPETILLRTREGRFRPGAAIVWYKNGAVQEILGEGEITGSPPPREPAYLGR